MHNDTGRIYCRGHNRRYFVVDDVVSIAVFFFFGRVNLLKHSVCIYGVI